MPIVGTDEEWAEVDVLGARRGVWVGVQLVVAAGCGRGAAERDEERETVAVTMAVEGFESRFWLDMFLSPLVEATGFSASILGCASGWSHTLNANSGSASVKMYRHDTGCYVALRSFSLGARTWVPVVGESFHRDAADAPQTSALFRFSADRDASVTNPSILPESLDDASTVTFRFGESNAGEGTSLLHTGSSGAVLGSGNVPAPELTWANLEPIVLSTGESDGNAAIYNLKLVCSGTFSEANPLQNSSCGGGSPPLLSDFRALLLLNTAAFDALDDAGKFSALDAEFTDANNASQIMTVASPERAWVNGASGGVQFERMGEKDGALLSGCRNYLLAVAQWSDSSALRSYRILRFDFASSTATCP